jgi:hypothetical protein
MYTGVFSVHIWSRNVQGRWLWIRISAVCNNICAGQVCKYVQGIMIDRQYVDLRALVPYHTAE